MATPPSSDPITVVTVLFTPGDAMPVSSRNYGPEWVNRLYRGVKRNTNKPFQFLCLTGEEYVDSPDFEPEIARELLHEDTHDVTCINEVHRDDLGIGQGFWMALDTVIIGNIDPLMGWTSNFAMPKLRFHGYEQAYNPVALYRPEETKVLWENRRDNRQVGYVMEEFGYSEQYYWNSFQERCGPIENLHKLFPRHIACCAWFSNERLERGEERLWTPEELRRDARVLYFYGRHKPDTPPAEVVDLVDQHWT